MTELAACLICGYWLFEDACLEGGADVDKTYLREDGLVLRAPVSRLARPRVERPR